VPRRAVLVTHDLSGPVAHKVSGPTQRGNELYEPGTRVAGDTHVALIRRSLFELA